MFGKSSITLSDALAQAQESWIQEGHGDFDIIAAKLDAELNRPGSRAAVIQWFIDGRYATSGSNVPATELINGSRASEIDSAFVGVVRFVESLGDAGESVAKKLISINRELLNNYKV
jgi:hypothetical protein